MRTNKPKVALAMIVAGRDDHAVPLAKCLASINYHVDAIYLDINHPKGKKVSDKVLRVAEQYKADVKVSVWEDNFVKARNDNFGRVPKSYDWIIWLDDDDTIWQPHKVREVAAIADSNIHGVFAQYDYDHDEFGNCTVTHRITRLIRNNGTFAWQASFDDGKVTVHEILAETRTVKKAFNDEFKVIHHASPEKREESLQRNIKLLEGMYEAQAKTKEVDPRILYYLGREYFNSGQYVNAEPVLVDYLKASGWAEERAEAWLHLGLIWDRFEKPDAARQAFGHAFLENPVNPRPLIELGRLEFTQKRYNMSEEFLLMGIGKKLPQTAYAVYPMENQYRAYMLLVQTYINMGFTKLKEARKYLEKAARLRPFDPLIKDTKELVDKLEKTRNNTRALVRLIAAYNEEKSQDKIRNLLDNVPEDMNDNPAVVTARMRYNKPTKWPKRSIAIYCGQSAEDIWGPWSLDETGIGGSEEAVVQMGRELAQLGWQVTVYATPGAKAGEYDGVQWKQYWEFNPKDEFDVLVGWRSPWFFEPEYKARKKFLWLHDVVEKNEFTPELLDKVDKVIFVSAYHAHLYKDIIPISKWFISGNGIDPRQFEKYDGRFERDTKRCLYMSSHLRGLEILYDVWPQVRKAVPEATLDVYYGWETFDSLLKDNPERMEWKRKMLKRAEELDGVTDAGRISHDQIAQEIQKSGILAYPCTFPEVYNISFVKAAAGGAYPVTSDFGCLPDYKDFSTQIHLDEDKEVFKREYAKALINSLKKPINDYDRQHMMEDTRDLYSWTKTAKGWSQVME